MTTTAGASEVLLELNNIVKAYGSAEKQLLAVGDVSLTLRSGEFTCLLGPSGCGKSTLLRIITGLNHATSGTVLYRGEQIKGVNPHATIVFQTFALYPWLTVKDNVQVALKARGVEPTARVERALQLIDTVGLDGFESAYPRELSGGMRHLDVLSAEALRGELMELWLSRAIPTKAVLMVTHNIEEAVLMADRIIVMSKDPGRIVTEFHVTLRHPRQRKDTAFQAEVDKVYAAVAGKQSESAEGELPQKKLPHARLNALAGLLEKLASDGGQADLQKLSSELILELDDLLPLVEAGDLLGFLVLDNGSLVLTARGHTYAEASILASKELLAGRVLRLRLISWIYDTLQRDDNRRTAWSYFLDKLQCDFGDLAEAQLDIAINWGRHAELFAYDDDTGELYLEE